MWPTPPSRTRWDEPRPRLAADWTTTRVVSPRAARQRRAAGRFARRRRDSAATSPPPRRGAGRVGVARGSASADQHGASGPSGSAWSAVIKARCARGNRRSVCARRSRRPPLTRGDAIGTRARRREPRRRGRRRRRHPARRRRASRVSPRAMARGARRARCAAAEAVAIAARAPLAAAVSGWAPSPAATDGSAAGLTRAGASLAANIIFGGAPGADVARGRRTFARWRLARSYTPGARWRRCAIALRAARAPSPADAADPAPNAPALLFLAALAASADVAAERRTSNDAETTSNGETVSPATRRALGFFFRAATGLATRVRRRIPPRRRTRTATRCSSRAIRCFDISSRFSAPDHVGVVRRRHRGAGAPRPAATARDRGRRGDADAAFSSDSGAARARWSARTPRSAVASEEARITAVVSRPENANRRESSRRAARLWANLLQYALDLGLWGAAYAAVLDARRGCADGGVASIGLRVVRAGRREGHRRGGVDFVTVRGSSSDGDARVGGRAAARPRMPFPIRRRFCASLRVSSRAPPRGGGGGARQGATIGGGGGRRRRRRGTRGERGTKMRVGRWGSSRARRRRARGLVGALLTAVSALRLCAPTNARWARRRGGGERGGWDGGTTRGRRRDGRGRRGERGGGRGRRRHGHGRQGE